MISLCGGVGGVVAHCTIWLGHVMGGWGGWWEAPRIFTKRLDQKYLDASILIATCALRLLGQKYSVGKLRYSEIVKIFNCKIFVILVQAACVRHHCCFHLLFWPRRLACALRTCVCHACLRAPCVAWPLLLPSFSLSFFFSFSLCLLLLTHFGESPVCENLFPPIFWHK